MGVTEAKIKVGKHRLSTNTTTANHRIHRWMNFIAGFSPEFVSHCIHEEGLSQNDVLIDPFAGFSTSLVQANLEGIKSIGFEPHPFVYDVAQDKLKLPSVSDVLMLKQKLLLVKPVKSLEKIWSDKAFEFLSKLVPSEELALLASALDLYINDQSRDSYPYKLVLSRVLEMASTAKTDGIYKAPGSLKNSSNYFKGVERVCSLMVDDLEALGSIENRSKLYQKSSEDMSQVADSSCAICVTSPPYLNNFDYAEMSRMELYFWQYAENWGEVTSKVRRKLIVNTTTAPTDLKKQQQLYIDELPKTFVRALEPLVAALKIQKTQRAGKKDYNLLVYPYFAQMQRIIKELHRVLKIGSPFHLVIGDAALYGVHIETHLLLAELLKLNGFEVAEIDQMRKRGDRWILSKRQGAEKGLGEYNIISRKVKKND